MSTPAHTSTPLHNPAPACHQSSLPVHSIPTQPHSCTSLKRLPVPSIPARTHACTSSKRLPSALFQNMSLVENHAVMLAWCSSCPICAPVDSFRNADTRTPRSIYATAWRRSEFRCPGAAAVKRGTEVRFLIPCSVAVALRIHSGVSLRRLRWRRARRCMCTRRQGPWRKALRPLRRLRRTLRIGGAGGPWFWRWPGWRFRSKMKNKK